MKNIKKFYFIFALLLILNPIFAQKDSLYNSDGYNVMDMFISPANPKINEPVYLIVKTQFTSGNCGFSDYTVNVQESYPPIIVIDAKPFQGMALYICYSVDSFLLGSFAQGDYYVNFNQKQKTKFSVSDSSLSCNLNGVVNTSHGIKGCGTLIYLDNGLAIEPLGFNEKILLQDKMNVALSYHEVMTFAPTTCPVASPVFVDCIRYLGDSVPVKCEALFKAYPISYSIDSVMPMIAIYPEVSIQNTFQFLDISTGIVTKWTWDFGDGSYSNEASPVHKYEKDGIYNVCLKIATNDQCTSEYCQTISVSNPVPLCNLYGKVIEQISATYSYFPFLIQLDAGGLIYPINMNAVYAVGTRVKLSYDSASVITPYDNDSIITLSKFEDPIQWPLPVYINCIEIVSYSNCDASFSYYQNYSDSTISNFVYKPQSESNEFVFASNNYDSEVKHQWEISDGSTYSEPKFIHQFKTSGIHKVCHTVISNDCESSDCQMLYVNAPYCQYYGTAVYENIDGCGMMFQLDNGDLINPIEGLYQSNFAAGARVKLDFEVIYDIYTTCMRGINARILCFEIVNNDSCIIPMVMEPIYYKTDEDKYYVDIKVDSLVNANEIQWMVNDETVSSGEASTMPYVYDSTYRICYDYNYCSACYDMKNAEMLASATPVRKIESNRIKVDAYPIPAGDNVTIYLQLENSSDVLINIQNMMGIELLSKGLDNIDEGTHYEQLDISKLLPGQYILTVGVGSEVKNILLIKL